MREAVAALIEVELATGSVSWRFGNERGVRVLGR
jgi:hypothetical protein